MLVKQFTICRAVDAGVFRWEASSEIEEPGYYRGFHVLGRTREDVKEFAALVRWCARTGKLEFLSEMHPPDWEGRMCTTWGGDWGPRGLPQD